MENTIFASIEDIRNYITIDISSDFGVIQPYIIQSEKYVRDITGDTLFEKLIIEANTPNNPQLAALLPYAQLALANFGNYNAIDKLNVNVGNAGITVASTSSLVPASKERIDRLRESTFNTGMDALERLLKFLEDKKSDYPEWSSSEAYSFQKEFFINNAGDFKTAIKKNIGRYEFLQTKEYLYLAHIEVQEAICDELYNEIQKEFELDNVSENNKKLLEYIKPAVCYLALGKKEESEKWKQEGEKRMKQLRNYLNAHAVDYPLYEASDCYNSSDIEINDDESGVYGFL